MLGWRRPWSVGGPGGRVRRKSCNTGKAVDDDDTDNDDDDGGSDDAYKEPQIAQSMLFLIGLVLILTLIWSYFAIVKHAGGSGQEKAKTMNPAAADPQTPRQKLVRRNTVFDSAQIVTFADVRNHLCCGIFKNPADHMTHFYRKKLKAPDTTNGSLGPLELRNISASIKLWGKHWDRIHHVKLCQKSTKALEEPSKWIGRLDDQKEDCQNKFGCQISLLDFETIHSVEKKVMSDLLDKIVNCSLSEDDLIYFNLQDDSDTVEKYYFDL